MTQYASDTPPTPTDAADIRVCPVCETHDWKRLYQRVPDYLTEEKFEVYRCRRCGLGITHPIPPPETLGKYYPARYRGNRHGFTDRFRMLQRSKSLAKQVAPGFRGRMLDIGCGAGSFALHQQSIGWQVVATEVDAGLIEKLRGKGLDAHLADDEMDAIAGPFDAITCWHVLEHVDDVNRLLDWVQRLLKPDGVFQVAVPNFSSVQASIFGKSWLHLDVPRHFYHFRADGLSMLLAKHNLETKSKTSFVLEYDWFGAIQSPLNMICTKRNLLFERLTVVENDPGRPIIDGIVSWLLAPILAIFTLPWCLLCWAFGRGASLGLTCRRARPTLESASAVVSTD